MSKPNALAAVLFAAVLAGGCTTASLQDAAPKTASAAAADSTDGPIDTGTYPNLNVKPQPAADQLSDNEAAGQKSALEAAKAGQGNARGASAAEMARLRKLAKLHGKEALEEIEK